MFLFSQFSSGFAQSFEPEDLLRGQFQVGEVSITEEGMIPLYSFVSAIQVEIVH
jgi:hypothetical protein